MAKGCFYSPFFCGRYTLAHATKSENKTAHELSEKQAVLGTNSKWRERTVRKTGGFGDKLQVARASCPKNRQLWGQTPSGESELSEKKAVLGTNFKRRERTVRKTGGFGYKPQVARTNYTERVRSRLLWVIKLQDNPSTTQFFINICHFFYILTDTDTPYFFIYCF